MKKQSILIMFVTLAIFLSNLNAQIYLTPRSVSYAHTFATQSRGFDVIGWNPANLGMEGNPGFSFTTTLIPTFTVPGIQVTNSIISRSWIDSYIFAGKELSSTDIKNLLSTIPEEGLTAGQKIQYRLLGLSIRRLAFAIDLEISGSQEIPKSLFKTAFEGVEFDQPRDLSDLNIQMQALAVISAAYGRPITIPYISDYVKSTSVGGGVKLLVGIANGVTDEFQAVIVSRRDELYLDGMADARYGLGGFGLALDLGISSVINDQMRAGISLNNLPGVIKWGLADVQEYQYHFLKRVKSSEIEDLMDADMDSVKEEAVLIDTVLSGNTYFSSYPGNLMVGFQYDLFNNLSFYFNYRQEFSNDFYSDITPRLSSAVKYEPLPWLPLRLGVSVGGREKFQWGAGFGLNFSHYAFDLGFSQTQGVFNSAKGFSFSIGQMLIF